MVILIEKRRMNWPKYLKKSFILAKKYYSHLTRRVFKRIMNNYSMGCNGELLAL
jgi:hypothetical protein